MSALFPAPVRSYTTFQDDQAAAAQSKPSGSSSSSTALSTSTRAIPAYPHRVAKQFVPRSLEDFGDGGAYPELHIAQFPLNMGKKGGSGSSGSSSKTLALQVRGEDGQANYDAIVTQHHRDKKVYTKFSDMVEKDDAKTLALPSKEEEMETLSRTKDALQLLVQGKIAASKPVTVARQKTAVETSSYIRYTPNDQGKMGGESKQRIIRMVEVAKDPMEPPKFKHTKAVRGPPSPPVPVLHSPPRKLTIQDQQSWKIPPCISNWKNSKGFTIALDKRMAADGRGLQQVTVNDNFASLSEALAIAERKAREEVNMRAQVQKKLVMKQKEQKENELREMASKARMERAGIRPEAGGDDRRRDYSDDERDYNRSDDDDGDEEGRRERDRIRRERKKEREREMRMEKLGKKGKLARDGDRDVSEKIALGQLQGSGKLAGDAMFDSRLFNQSQGLNSGFGGDDEYSVYSKPLVDRGKASVYRPKADDVGGVDAEKDYEELKTGHSKRFKADKQFRGTEEAGRGRDGPVQFSYDNIPDEVEEDRKQSPAARDRNDRPGRGRSPSRERRRASPSRSRSRSRSLQRARSRRRSPSRSRSPDDRRRTTRRRSPSRSRSPSRDRKRSRRNSDDSDGDDPFGLDQFLRDARSPSKKDSSSRDSRRR